MPHIHRGKLIVFYSFRSPRIPNWIVCGAEAQRASHAWRIITLCNEMPHNSFVGWCRRRLLHNFFSCCCLFLGHLEPDSDTQNIKLKNSRVARHTSVLVARKRCWKHFLVCAWRHEAMLPIEEAAAECTLDIFDALISIQLSESVDGFEKRRGSIINDCWSTRLQTMCSIIRLSAPLSFFTRRLVFSFNCDDLKFASVSRRHFFISMDTNADVSLRCTHVTAHSTQCRRWDTHKFCKRKQNKLCG